MPNNAAIVAAGGSPLAVGQRRPVSPHGLSAVRARILVPVCGYVDLFSIDLAHPFTGMPVQSLTLTVHMVGAPK